MVEEIYRTYPHNPPHLFRPCAIYIVTGGTLYKQPFLNSGEKKARFCRVLFEQALIYRWEIEAWAVLNNRYHFVTQAPEEAENLRRFIQALHSATARYFNRLDGTPERRVWYNYWDTCITYETSYLARLHYVHTNPVKHGVVADARDYPFCSYGWFMEQASSEFRQQVFNQPCDRVRVKDDF